MHDAMKTDTSDSACEDTAPATAQPDLSAQPYSIEDQIGFSIRRAHQRASAIFGQHFKDTGLSPVQFAALVKVRDEGRLSQNQLGRLTYVDPATIAGVVGRLADKNLIRRFSDPVDRRRTVIAITSTGLSLVEQYESAGFAVSRETLAPLTDQEQALFAALIHKLT